MTRIALIAASALIGSAVITAPAFAGGSVSFTYTPANPHDAQALSTGLRLYSLYEYSKANGGVITQQGLMNAAGLSQNGANDLGIIAQKGKGNTGTLAQNGSNDTYGIFQFGKGGTTNVTQNGNGKTGITIQDSW